MTADALAQLPNPRSDGVLVRADGAGGTKAFVSWLTEHRLGYSVGFTLPFHTPELYRLIPEHDWEAALDSDQQPREGAAVEPDPLFRTPTLRR